MFTSTWPPIRADGGSHSTDTSCRAPARHKPQRRSQGLEPLAETLTGSALPTTAHRSVGWLESAVHFQSFAVPSGFLSRTIGAVGRAGPTRVVGPAARRRQSGSRGEYFPVSGLVPMRTIDALKGAIGGSEGEYLRFGGLALNGNIGGSQTGK